MRRSLFILLALVLLVGTAPLASESLSVPANVPDASQPALTTELLLAMANDTRSTATFESQAGIAQLMILMMDMSIPAFNDKNPAVMNVDNSMSDMIDDTGGGADKLPLSTRIEDLLQQITRIAAGTRSGGDPTLVATAETTLLSLYQKYYQQLTTTLNNTNPGSTAFRTNIDELLALRTRLAALVNSSNVGEGARTLLRELETELESYYELRVPALVAVIGNADASEADKTAAALELLRIAASAESLPTGTSAGSAERDARTFFQGYLTSLTTILDSETATDAEKTDALTKLRQLRDALLEFDTGSSFTASSRDPSPVGDLLGVIEKRIYTDIAARIGVLNGTINNTSTSPAARAEAITELMYLWGELSGLLHAQNALNDESDSGLSDLVTTVRTRLVSLIQQRYNTLSTTLSEDSSGTELSAGAGELFTAWERLRELGQTDTQLYDDLETSLRSMYRFQTLGLLDTLDDATSTAAARNAAAESLGQILTQLKILDATRGTPDRPAYDATRNDIEENLGGYIGTRVEQLGTVLDNANSTTTEKDAAIAELRQLRAILTGPLGATGGYATGALQAGNATLSAIDARLGALATARVNELAQIIQSATATTAQKQQAITELEGLRSTIRNLGADPMGTIEPRIDDLLQQGLKGLLDGLKDEADGETGTGPITRGTLSGAGDPVAVNLTETPDAVASSAVALANFGKPGGPTIAALARSTGNSTGPGAFEFLFANSGPAADIDGNGLVLEPIAAEDVDAVLAEWSRVVDAANAVVAGTPEGYCLEQEKRPPEPGELFAITTRGKQQQFSPERSIIESGRRLFESGSMTPEQGNDPDAYMQSILQWAIWAKEGTFNEGDFTEAFVEHTRENLEGQGFEWTEAIESEVRSWAPNRWTDVTNVLTGANLGATA